MSKTQTSSVAGVAKDAHGGGAVAYGAATRQLGPPAVAALVMLALVFGGCCSNVRQSISRIELC